MAKKKMYFYNLNLEKNKKKIGSDDIKAVFISILENINNSGSLSIDKSSDRITLDKSFFNGDYFFARLGREQDITSLAIRDSYNREASDVNRNGMWIDKLTYILVDFRLKLFTIVNNQSAPRASALHKMFSLYAPEYTLILDELPNQKYYETLYTTGSSISKIRYKMAVPNVNALQNIPGLSERQFQNIKLMDAQYFEIVISTEPRKFLSNNKKVVSEIIMDTAERAKEYEKFEIEGTPSNSTKHTFDLKDEYFSFEIAIDNTKVQDKEKIYKTSTELSNDYREKMIDVIVKNKDYLERFIN